MMTSSCTCKEFSSLDLKGIQMDAIPLDVVCPICLDTPHNGVLLQCSSYSKGCRPFICDTDDSLSNCLDRYKNANGLPAVAVRSPTENVNANDNCFIQLKPDNNLTCPLCRGEITGWLIIDELRMFMNMKKRCCEESQCMYLGNYDELQEHTKQEHPQARPSRVDPEQQQDWENFQESSEIIDVLNTIHSGTPHGFVLGDYVIEYGDDTSDEFEDFPGDDGNWWTSCILYHVFDNLRTSRNRSRSRANQARRNRHRSSSDAAIGNEATTSFTNISEHNFDLINERYVVVDAEASPTESDNHHSLWRHRSHFRDA